MNPKFIHPPPPPDYPGLSHYQKKNRKRGKSLHFIFLLVGVLLFSVIVSYLILTLVREQKETAITRLNFPNYRPLFRNYKVLIEFNNLSVRTDRIQDAEFEINNPFILDVQKLKDAASDLEKNREKDTSRIADIILDIESKHKSHPYRYSFILHKKNKLYLKYLYFENKSDELITWYDNNAHLFDTLELKLFLINSYLRTRNTDKAFEMFKELFAKNRLKPFSDYLPPQTLNLFLRRLDYEYWFGKFKYLAKTDQSSEFLVESRYISNPQLVTLFTAEFAYKQKQYDQCRRYLESVKSENLLTYKERIIFKSDLWEGNTNNLREKLALMEKDPEIFIEVLFDAASILLIEGEWDLSQDFYLRYVAYSKLIQFIHWLRSPFLPSLASNYWKVLGMSAWISYKKNNKPQAAVYFKQGIDSPILSYRLSNRYWLQQLEKNTSQLLDLDKYPFTYYYTCHKQPHDLHHAHNSLNPFINLLNHEQGPDVGKIFDDLRDFVYYNLLDEAVDFIQWTVAEKGLSVSDKHTLILIKSLLYLKQGNDAMAFFNFRDNFECYQCIRLPRFLSQVVFPFKYVDLIDQYCEEFKLDRSLVLALIRKESFFRPGVRSPANAYGLMQLLIKTARQVAYSHRMKVFPGDLFDPEKNIRLGTEYLRILLDRYNQKLHLALAAYNAGYERVDVWMNRFGTVKDNEFIEMIPITETRNYVKTVLRNYFYYRFYYGQ